MTETTFPVFNPATGEEVARVAEMGRAGARIAIERAHAAQPEWAARSGKARSQILRKWFDLILQHQEELAILITREAGKPLAESRGEVAYGASFVEWFAEEAKRIYGDIIPATTADKRLLVLKQPVGVTAAITPWNFPLAMITRKAAPALAVGCTMVVKPSEETPLTALRLAELAYEAGIPKGVLSIVTGTDAAAIGSELTGNPLVRKISFTGSTAVGKLLMSQSAATIKKISLELGGNAPFIVFDDADIDAAVRGAVAAKYRNAGQTCVCVNRFLVQDGVYDLFATQLTAAVRTLKVGNGLVDGTAIGPLINQRGVAKARRHLEDALALGAKLLIGGKVLAEPGCFFAPTVLAEVPVTALVAHEETFAPIAPLFRFRTEQEAIALANQTESGLAAYFYSRDHHRVWRVMEQLEYGMVGVNEGIISTEVAPFGGVKQAGLGREGSRYGADEYIEMKYACMGGF